MKHCINARLFLDDTDTTTLTAIRAFLVANRAHFRRIDATEGSFVEYHPCYNDERALGKKCDPAAVQRWDAP